MEKSPNQETGSTLNHLELIWYHLELSSVPYSLDQFLGWDFLCRFLRQEGSNAYCPNIYTVHEGVICLICFLAFRHLLE